MTAPGVAPTMLTIRGRRVFAPVADAGRAGRGCGAERLAAAASRGSRQAIRRKAAAADGAANTLNLTDQQQQQQLQADHVRVPHSLHDVDNGKILGFGAELGPDHPGFFDEEYKRRRVMIAEKAKRHKIGTPIPELTYLPEEVETWGSALTKLQSLYPTHACAEFNRCFPSFGFRPDRVPQLEEVSSVLRQTTGWQIRPVAGLMHPRDFLNGLAFKAFHSTQYMRHPSKPDYTPEPDVVHELLGHVPMLADPLFCELMHAIGLASLGASESQIWHLTKVYWYTVEFGVVRGAESGDGGLPVRAFGAGVLSSYGELEWMGRMQAELVDFDPWAKQPKMSYKDGFQKRYFVLESFEKGAKMLKEYAESISAPGLER